MVAANTNLVLGIVLVVLGILVLTGNFPFLSAIIYLAGIALIVVGILMLLKKMAGGTVLGVAAIVAGALLVIPAQFLGGGVIANVLHITIGVVLLVFGILKLSQK